MKLPKITKEFIARIALALLIIIPLLLALFVPLTASASSYEDSDIEQLLSVQYYGGTIGVGYDYYGNSVFATPNLPRLIGDYPPVDSEIPFNIGEVAYTYLPDVDTIDGKTYFDHLIPSFRLKGVNEPRYHRIVFNFPSMSFYDSANEADLYNHINNDPLFDWTFYPVVDYDWGTESAYHYVINFASIDGEISSYEETFYFDSSDNELNGREYAQIMYAGMTPEARRQPIYSVEIYWEATQFNAPAVYDAGDGVVELDEALSISDSCCDLWLPYYRNDLLKEKVADYYARVAYELGYGRGYDIGYDLGNIEGYTDGVTDTLAGESGVGWLLDAGDAVLGFTLFSAGDVDVTLGLLLSIAFGIPALIWIIRVFAGG